MGMSTCNKWAEYAIIWAFEKNIPISRYFMLALAKDHSSCTPNPRWTHRKGPGFCGWSKRHHQNGASMSFHHESRGTKPDKVYTNGNSTMRNWGVFKKKQKKNIGLSRRTRMMGAVIWCHYGIWCMKAPCRFKRPAVPGIFHGTVTNHLLYWLHVDPTATFGPLKNTRSKGLCIVVHPVNGGFTSAHFKYQ